MAIAVQHYNSDLETVFDLDARNIDLLLIKVENEITISSVVSSELKIVADRMRLCLKFGQILTPEIDRLIIHLQTALHSTQIDSNAVQLERLILEPLQFLYEYRKDNCEISMKDLAEVRRQILLSIIILDYSCSDIIYGRKPK